MITLTGDTHRQFKRIKEFYEKNNTTKEDILIILGDAGINYYGYVWDREVKEFLANLPITIFAIHGNHEMRPESLEYYHTQIWHEGLVYVEDDFPSLLFAKDGEIYNIGGKKVIAIGGAYSVDKNIRLLRGWKWFLDEQPSDTIKSYVEEQLNRVEWKIDIVLSHTTPYSYMPVECFMRSVDQSRVDYSTEHWLDTLEEKMEYTNWFSGHFHCQKRIDKLEILFENYVVLD